MWDAARRGAWPRADPDLTRRFLDDRGPFYLIARALSVAYAVASLPLVFAIGCAAFDPWVGLAATWIAFLSPLALSHAQIARTDSAGMFFTSLSVWLCLRLRERPSMGRSIAAGAAIGLGVASRYFLVTLTPVLLAAQAAGFRRSWRTAWPVVAGGLLAIPVAFVAASPFFLLDLADGATRSAVAEHEYAPRRRRAVVRRKPRLLRARGRPGAALDAARAARRRRRVPRAAPAPSLGMAARPHGRGVRRRHRPLAAALGALADRRAGGAERARGGTDRAGGPPIPGRLLQPLAATIALAVLSAGPLSAMVRSSVQLANPSTRVQAREWILANLPPGARIAQEWYTAPLDGSGFAVSESMSLARGKTLDWYRSNGVRYLVTSDAIAGRFLMEPQRYSRELAFYGALAREGRLLQELVPSPARAGPRIRT